VLSQHISTRHSSEACRDAGLPYSPPRKLATRIAKRLQEKYGIFDPAVNSILVPLPTDPPIPYLKLYRGYKYTRCEYVLPEAKRAQRRARSTARSTDGSTVRWRRCLGVRARQE
jgi:hypothetical protein